VDFSISESLLADGGDMWVMFWPYEKDEKALCPILSKNSRQFV
jgi:hypothetical protein